MKLSIIIPCFKDPLLQKTINSLLENSELGEEMEIIVILDGYEFKVESNPRVRVVSLTTNKGMRTAINAGISAATGEFLMKCDAHCMFGLGYDRIMYENCKENWILIPSRYSLDEVKWTVDFGRPVRDYHYFSFPHLTLPAKNAYDGSMEMAEWNSKRDERKDFDIDDTLTFQGSCWFANRKFFMKRVGFLDDNPKTYGPFGREQMEIGLKYWLGGGEVKVIKRTWYAHLWKRKRHYDSGLYTRDYKKVRTILYNRLWSTRHWMNDEEPNMIHSFAWLIDKFSPPGWEPNWKEIWKSSMGTELCKIAYKYGTDKCPQLKHSYTPFYFELLKDKRDSIKKVLELGIGCYQGMRENEVFYDKSLDRKYHRGASLYMWREFFPNAQIYGADYKKETMFKDDRIETFECDERKKEDIERVINAVGSDVDLFIDDGSHETEHQIFLAQTLMPLLKKDVIYIIEDVKGPADIIKALDKYDCQLEEFTKKYKNDKLIIVKNK